MNKYNFTSIQLIDPLFRYLEKCRLVTQSEEHHPEGDVFNHSLQVMKWAFKESNNIDLIIAAINHDIGKQVDTHGHEDYAIKLLKGYITEKTEWLIKNHMRIWKLLLGQMKRYKKVQDLINHEWFKDLCLLARWDKLGRNKNIVIKYDRVDIINRLIKIQEIQNARETSY